LSITALFFQLKANTEEIVAIDAFKVVGETFFSTFKAIGDFDHLTSLYGQVGGFGYLPSFLLFLSSISGISSIVGFIEMVRKDWKEKDEKDKKIPRK
jgi:hypothetical protein